MGSRNSTGSMPNNNTCICIVLYCIVLNTSNYHDNSSTLYATIGNREEEEMVLDQGGSQSAGSVPR